MRILAHEGWRENLSGHITWCDRRRRDVVQPVGHLVGGGAGLRHPAPRRRRRDRRGHVGRHARGLPAHRAAPRPARRRGHRAQPSRTTRRCSRRWASCRGSCTRTRASSTASSRSSTSTAGVEDADDGQVARGAGRRRERHPARAPRRDRHRADDRRGVLQGRHVRAHVPLHLRHARGRPHAAGDPGRRARRAEAAAAPEHAARRTGTARSACCSRDEPEVLT